MGFLGHSSCEKMTTSPECLSELHRAHESALNLRDLARQAYIARGKLCSKLLKYPNVEDYTARLGIISHESF